ncbi:MAG: tol-pal system protein YbgF [Thermodesulfobacteriota bacterium]
MKSWSSYMWLGAIIVLAVTGCLPIATEDSVLRVESRLRGVQLEVQKLKRNPAPGLYSRVDDLSKEVDSLKGELSSRKRETRASLADLLTSLDRMKGEFQKLTGAIEEAKFEARKGAHGLTGLKEDLSPKVYFIDNLVKAQQERLKALELSSNRVHSALAELEKSLASVKDENQKRLAKLEEGLARIGASQRSALVAKPKRVPREKGKTALVPKPAASPPPTPMEQAYQEAFDSYSVGEYKQASEKFKSFLKKFPTSSLRSNAQFWLAESSFSMKNYEEAILEYEELLAKFPGGDKAPVAMLKQGLAFLELGDKIDARLLFNRLAAKFPNSEEAKTARSKLKQIK